MTDWLIRGARLIDPSQGVDERLDIRLADGIIQEIGEGLEAHGEEILNAEGLIGAPGLVDMHVHLREPGQTHKEDILSGCEAAGGRGGVTSLACMPNTNPVCDSPDTSGKFSAAPHRPRRGFTRWQRQPPPWAGKG